MECGDRVYWLHSKKFTWRTTVGIVIDKKDYECCHGSCQFPCVALRSLPRASPISGAPARVVTDYIYYLLATWPRGPGGYVCRLVGLPRSQRAMSQSRPGARRYTSGHASIHFRRRARARALTLLLSPSHVRRLAFPVHFVACGPPLLPFRYCCWHMPPNLGQSQDSRRGGNKFADRLGPYSF